MAMVHANYSIISIMQFKHVYLLEMIDCVLDLYSLCNFIPKYNLQNSGNTSRILLGRINWGQNVIEIFMLQVYITGVQICTKSFLPLSLSLWIPFSFKLLLWVKLKTCHSIIYTTQAGKTSFNWVHVHFWDENNELQLSLH